MKLLIEIEAENESPEEIEKDVEKYVKIKGEILINSTSIKFTKILKYFSNQTLQNK